MLLNKLHLSLAWGRQTGKTRQSTALWRYERYSFMQAMEPIYAIFPKKVSFPNLVIDGVKVIRNLETTTSHPPVNVGTIGHCDW
ncbi:hypothetical protein D3C85_272660 [compost metagenome]|jgi:hypothetical protein